VIKVESNMLVLDSTFSKEDAEAITYFVNIAKAEERERILSSLETMRDSMAAMETGYGPHSGNMSIRIKTLDLAMSVIKGENK
jgi:hypothetical protein